MYQALCSLPPALFVSPNDGSIPFIGVDEAAAICCAVDSDDRASSTRTLCVSSTLTTITPSVVYPTSNPRRAFAPRMRTPELINKGTQIATCTTTSAFLSRAGRHAFENSRLVAKMTSPRVLWTAGTSPNMMVANSAATIVKIRTRVSACNGTSWTRSSMPAGRVANMMFTLPLMSICDRGTARQPAANAISVDSVTNCRISLPGVAQGPVGSRVRADVPNHGRASCSPHSRKPARAPVRTRYRRG